MPLQFNKAKFSKSYGKASEIKYGTRPEFAFIGRSNVGKSSLINAITGNKALAKTSSLPGKTQLINYFNIEDKLSFVDLPGYGYAKVSKKKREEFEGLISDYILSSKDLFVLFVLIDSSIPPQQIDLDFVNWCGFHQIPIALVFTKIDKNKSKQVQKNIDNFQMALSKSWTQMPLVFITSSQKGNGVDDLKTWIAQEI